MPCCPHCSEEVAPSDLIYDDNSFRDDPEPNQTRLDELGGGSTADPSDGLIWGRVDLDDLDLDALTPDDPDREFGDPINANDPHEW